MSKSKVWKDFERELAKWFNTVRNIGSGRINSTDAGEPRPGDIVLVEPWELDQDETSNTDNAGDTGAHVRCSEDNG